MNCKLNKFFLLLLVTIFSCIPISNTSAFENTNTNETSKLVLLSADKKNSSEETNEDSDVFEFIKDKNNSLKDFFYDGSALLYGGILLILISIFGIFKTLKPRKRRKKHKTNRPTTMRRR